MLTWSLMVLRFSLRRPQDISRCRQPHAELSPVLVEQRRVRGDDDVRLVMGGCATCHRVGWTLLARGRAAAYDPEKPPRVVLTAVIGPSSCRAPGRRDVRAQEVADVDRVLRLRLIAASVRRRRICPGPASGRRARRRT